MVTNNFFLSNLPHIHHIVQNSMTLYPKELVIAQLRDFFSRDQYYHYVHDRFGYPQTPDHTNLPLNAGFRNNITTRVFIGESYRFDVIYYPAIIVRHGGATSVPISANRETGQVIWGNLIFEDGYGNIKTFPNPEKFLFAGAYEGSLTVDIMARDLRTRDDLVDLVSILFIDIGFNDLWKSGLVIQNVSAGSPTETDDRNDHIFKQTITLKIRNEWRRQIPIKNIIDVINMSIQFAGSIPTVPDAPNIAIETGESLAEMIMNL